MSCRRAACASSSRSCAPRPCSSSVSSNSSNAWVRTVPWCSPSGPQRRASRATDAVRTRPGEAGAGTPTSSRITPSRSPRSECTAPSAPNTPSAVASTTAPAGSSSARRSSIPGRASRSDWSRSASSRERSSSASSRNSNWFSEAGGEGHRSAASSRASAPAVPPAAMQRVPSGAPERSRAGANRSLTWALIARRSPGDIGSVRTSVVVIHAAPSGNVSVHRTRPPSTSASSRLPPPRSIAIQGSVSIVTLARMPATVARASRSPERIRSGVPIAASIVEASSGRLAASRNAAVATGITSSTAARSARSRKRRTTWEARSSAPGGTRPVAATSAPRFNTTRSRATGVNPPSGSTSPTSSWNEVLPRSKTATRTAGSLSGAVARRRFVPQPGWEPQVAIQHPDRPLLPHHRPLDRHPVLGQWAHDLRDRVAVGAQDGRAGEHADRLEERRPVGPLEEPRHLLDLETTIPSERLDRLDTATDGTRQDPIDRTAAERRDEPVRLPFALDGQRPVAIVSPPLRARAGLRVADHVEGLRQPSRFGQHLSVALVREGGGSRLHRDPGQGVDLVIGPEGFRPVRLDQPVTHHLRTAERVGVAHALQLGSELARHPRLLADLTKGSGLDRLSVVCLPLRQRQIVVAGPVDDQRLEDAGPPTEDDATRGKDDVVAHQNRRFFFASDRHASGHAARVWTRTRSRPAPIHPAANACAGSAAASAASLSIATTESWCRPSTSCSRAAAFAKTAARSPTNGASAPAAYRTRLARIR